MKKTLSDFEAWLKSKKACINSWINNISDTAYRARQDVRDEYYKNIRELTFIGYALKWIEEFENERE